MGKLYRPANSLQLNLLYTTGSPSSQCEELSFFIISFVCFYVNVQQNVTYTATIYYNHITTEFEYTKRDARLAAYGGVALQLFEFIKVCVGTQLTVLLQESLYNI